MNFFILWEEQIENNVPGNRGMTDNTNNALNAKRLAASTSWSTWAVYA